MQQLASVGYGSALIASTGTVMVGGSEAQLLRDTEGTESPLISERAKSLNTIADLGLNASQVQETAGRFQKVKIKIKLSRSGE